MQVHCLQHVPFEGLGSIEPWLGKAGCQISTTRWFEASALPQPGQLDLLVVMGGPMSVNDEDAFPWLAQEKRFIRNVIEAGKPILGICLGAQLIAAAAGARVYPNAVKEIGWFPVQGIASKASTAFRFPPSLRAFHWHGETFDLPRGAIRLARSPGCENQAFQIGSSIIGLQFHLETTPLSARQIIDNCRNELVRSQYVQSENEILAEKPQSYADINAVMGEVLSFLLPGIGRTQPDA